MFIPNGPIITLAQPHLAAMMTAAEFEWRTYAPEDWTATNFRRWPRGFHCSAWVVARYIGWNPLDALPNGLRDSSMAEALEVIADLDLTAFDETEPPRGYGRD